ncbi:hypothetical protein HKCCE2091_17570 [Rhodobacterales bacterium HKCCE2091]|nr:hypothetical protein [Rhodobacterales bacterium HKCCE2091]
MAAITFDLTGDSKNLDELLLSIDGVTLTITSGLYQTDDFAIYETTPLLNRTAEGLGMRNPYGDREDGIDGDGRFEVAVLSFSETVRVTGVVLTPLGTPFNPTGAGTGFRLFGDDLLSVSGRQPIVSGGNTLDLIADLFGFGTDDGNDQFRIASITIETLTEGPRVTDLPGASISGRVFFDADGDGIDENDAGAGGKLVRLVSDTGSIVATTYTESNGNYLFYDLTPGNYAVRVDIGMDEEFSPANQGPEATDSDIVTLWTKWHRGQTDFIAVAAEQDVTDVDAGIAGAVAPPPPPPPPPPATGSVSGRVFVDADGSQTETAGDMPGAGYGVALQAADGSVVASTTTAADGSYGFTGIAAGDYRVVFTAETDRAYVTPGQGGSAIDSDVTVSAGGVGQTAIFTLAAGAALADVDAGLVPSVAPPPPPPPPPPTGNGATISGRLYQDVNGNGIDDGEAGSAGNVVRLMDANQRFVTSTRTAADGSYSFEGLDAGDYFVRIDIADSFNFTALNQGDDDSVDSDILTFWDRFNRGQTDVIHVQTDEVVADVDAGFWAGAAGDGIIFV